VTASRRSPRALFGIVTALAVALGGVALTPAVANAAPGDIVSGIVTGADGGVIDDAALTFNPTDGNQDNIGYASGDLNGAYSIDYLQNGDYSVRVNGSGYADLDFPFTATGGDQTFNVVLPLATRYTVTGRVTSGSDVAGTVVTVVWLQDQSVVGTATVDAAGNYSVPGVLDGESYTVTLSDPLGAYESKVEQIDINAFGAGYTGPVVNFTLEAPGFGIARAAVLSGTAEYGTAVFGETITASVDSWQPAATTYAYQWVRNGVAVAGATGTTYTISAADFGATIALSVTGSKRGYTTSTTTSIPVTAVPGTLVQDYAYIAGEPSVGSTLKATVKVGPGATLKYTWLRNGKAIKGATKSSYKLTTSDLGKKITLTTSAERTGYTTVTSKNTTVTIKKNLTSYKPKVSGTAKVGKTLKATVKAWKPGKVKLTYQWLVEGFPIPKATKSTYKIAKKYKGAQISVVVIGKKTGYATEYSYSKATKAVKK
jgi:hypothetical protein